MQNTFTRHHDADNILLAYYTTEQVATLQRKFQEGWPLHVFIAGPIDSSGATHLNLRNAVLEADILHKNKIFCFVPHFGVAWEQIAGPSPRECWINWCNAWLIKCDAMIRIPGRSVGADGEVQRSIDQNKPVFLSAHSLLKVLIG